MMRAVNDVYAINELRKTEGASTMSGWRRDGRDRG